MADPLGWDDRTAAEDGCETERKPVEVKKYKMRKVGAEGDYDRVLQAVVAETDAEVVTQIWGFDPLELLETVEFPNDRFERLLRLSKEARMLALRRQQIPLARPASNSGSNGHLFFPSADVKVDSINGVRIDSQTSLTNLAVSKGSAGDLKITTNADGSLMGNMPAVKAAAASHNANMSQTNASIQAEMERKEEMALREQLARSSAALMIQCAFRGWVTRRKYLAVVHSRLSLQSLESSTAQRSMTGLPQVEDLTVQERLIRRYKIYCRYFEVLDKPLPDFPHFCAAQIQSIFRMFVIMKSYMRIKSMTKEDMRGIAGKEAKNAMVRLGERMDLKAGAYTDAARRIQSIWRKHYAKKIFAFYRELIRFRERGDPRKLLKFVNPKEAQLIDGACGMHVRFRLGGSNFPPTVYYKIYIHSKLIDMNAFSPRDYTTESKQLPPRVLFSKTESAPTIPTNEHKHGGWYRRFENNGWRPVSDRVWEERESDEVTVRTTKPAIPFHFSKLKRRQELVRAKRQKKLEWLKAMYSEGKKHLRDHSIPEAAETITFENESEVDGLVVAKSVRSRHRSRSPGGPAGGEGRQTPLQTEEDLLKAISDLEKELDHDVLAKWSEALDYEGYLDRWMGTSLTGRSDDPATFVIDFDNVSDIGNAFAKGIRALKDLGQGGLVKHEGGDPSTVVGGVNREDLMLAEIDLFRKIAEEINGPVGSAAGSTPAGEHGPSGASGQPLIRIDGKDGRPLSAAAIGLPEITMSDYDDVQERPWSGTYKGRASESREGSAAKKERPWSGKSGMSMGDMFLTKTDEEF